MEDTKRVIRSRKSEVVNQTTQWPNETGQKEKKTIYKKLHRKLKMEQHERHAHPGVN